MMRRFVIPIVLAAFSAIPSPARAVGLPPVPPGAIAWWRFDPSGFAAANRPIPGRELFVASLRAAISSGLAGEGTPAQVLEGLLAASDVGAGPHTLCLMQFRASRQSSGTGIDIHDFQMVLRIEAGRDHADILRTIRAILVDAPHARGDQNNASDPAQRRLDLPGGRSGVAFTRRNWKPWREVSWCSAEEAFFVGLGRDALSHYFGALDEPVENDTAEPWLRHAALVDEARPDGPLFCQAYLDFRKLRSTFPDAFFTGRTPRMLRALDLDQAQDLMLHGRFIESAHEQTPPLIVLDATLTPTPRAQALGVSIERRPISESVWPADAELMPRPPGSYVVVIRTDWKPLFHRALDIYQATIKDRQVPQFDAARAAWLERNNDAVELLFAQLEPWLIIADYPTPIIPAPGLSTLYAPVRRGLDTAIIGRAFAQLLSDFAARIAQDGLDTWSLRIDPTGAIRFPVWGIAKGVGRDFLIGGWGPHVLTTNRAWFARPSTPSQPADPGR